MFFVPANTGDRPTNCHSTDHQSIGSARIPARFLGLVKLTMAALALGSAISGMLARVERQRMAVAAIERLGGAVAYESAGDSYGGLHDWLRTWLGRDAFDDVEAVYLSGTPATDADLACLLSLRRIKTIGLASTRVTDDGLPYLRTCELLMHVDLRFTEVSPGAAAALRQALPQAKVQSVSDVE